ncbi:hypothetical protein PT974_04311 [Cladobotryum mycophilum]|uniref:Uncharacterized protein n=1 Tax=Cladobotryum mycophilum TaxID=491253 RepID=A0ABR0SUQ4_9HYPO
MSQSRKAAYVGYVEDAEDDSGSSIHGIASTRKYATSEAPRSPTKERPNTGKSRGGGRLMPDSDDESVSSVSLTDSDSTARSPKRDKPRPKDPRRPVHKDRERAQRDLDREHRDRERRKREARKHKEEDDRRRARAEAAREKERDSRALKKTRPPAPKHAATQPIVQQGGYRRGHLDDPAAYGVQQPAASGSRPRAQTRPASYYAGQPPRPPPMANMNWSGPPPPPPFPVGSFPPPPHMFHGHGPGPSPMPHHIPPSPMGPPGYFDGFMGGPPPPPPPQGEPLRNRFDRRPSSAMGFASPPSANSYLPEEYGYEEELPHPRVNRRSSRSKRPTEDRKKMPPPEFLPKRTQSARPTTAPFKAPTPRERPQSRQSQRPPASHRRSVGFADQHALAFDDADLLGEVDLFHDVSPDQRRTALTRARRSSMAYEQHGMDIVPANSRGRRSSVYGASGLENGGVSLEDDRYFDAIRYQDDVSGGSGMPLTAESLRRASKRGEASSSRSTRSTESHDESEYKRSNTTGITRSSSGNNNNNNNNNNDDFTIKVSGAAVVRVSGAEIECNDGGEITVSSGRPQMGASRAGSDKESTVYQLEDARSARFERKALTHRPRAPSHADTQSRYAPSVYDPEPYEQITYEHAPYDPALAASNFY